MDKEAMSQVIFNLLDNAVRFSTDPKEIEVTAGNERNWCVIRIKDKGIGIDKDEAAKIFEKFYRGKAANVYSANGTGLGLTLVKYIVDAHGGNIKVEYEPGWSTVISVRLPGKKQKIWKLKWERKF